jgi:hypothetical protein
MASLETVSEIVKRIEGKIDQLNGSVKSLGDWRILHQEETKAQNEKIGSLLRVVAGIVLIYSLKDGTLITA